jgi:hypothetical protein
LTSTNNKLIEEKQSLEEKLNKVIAQKDLQQSEMDKQAEQMKEMARNLALLMAEHTKTDGDLDMQNEGKRNNPTSRSTNASAEESYKQQKNRRTTPDPRNLFKNNNKKSPPRSPTLSRIGKAANRPIPTSGHQPTPTYATTNGGAAR